MKTFSQWVVWRIKENLGIISPSLYYSNKKYRDKLENSKLKFIPDWLVWVVVVVIIVLYWVIFFYLLGGL